MYKLSLAHIYPNLLNFYGDSANVLALKKRCEWRNITLEVVEINEDEKINSDFDLYFLGGATIEQQALAAKKLIIQKEPLNLAAQNNAIILAISESYQLLGNYIQDRNNIKTTGLGLLDIYSVEQNERFVGNVTAHCKYLSPQEVIGFENHSIKTYLNKETTPLFHINIGKGNNGEDKTEGARKNNVFGTYLHGAFLPKNPYFTDYLIKLALEKKYGEKIKLEKLNDKIETTTYKKLIGKKY